MEHRLHVSIVLCPLHFCKYFILFNYNLYIITEDIRVVPMVFSRIPFLCGWIPSWPQKSGHDSEKCMWMHHHVGFLFQIIRACVLKSALGVHIIHVPIGVFLLTKYVNVLFIDNARQTQHFQMICDIWANVVYTCNIWVKLYGSKNLYLQFNIRLGNSTWWINLTNRNSTKYWPKYQFKFTTIWLKLPSIKCGANAA